MILTIILKIINEIPGCGESDWRYPKGIKGVKYKFDILLCAVIILFHLFKDNFILIVIFGIDNSINSNSL